MYNFRLQIASFLWVLSITAAFGQDPVLLKVGNTEVKASEFKYIYEKNNGNNADYSTKSVMEYLDLYTKFKLKVQKARAMQLDTIGSLKTELEGYRKQLAASYLIDKGVTDFLMQELYDRMKSDVEFSHIFVPISETANTADKTAAKSILIEAKTKIAGGMAFEEAARLYSGDKTTAAKGGAMGYYTAKLPNGFYNLESALYNTPEGGVSDIIETKIGYHVIKVTQKRPAVGIVEVAHILVGSDKRTLADSLVKVIAAGGDWDRLALQYSIDKTSNKNGGKLAPFGLNTYDKAFEDVSFFLSDKNRLSIPVMTKSGWHIIKLINKVPRDGYELFVRKMKANISKDQRFDAAKVKLVDDIKKAGNIQENKSLLAEFATTIGEDFYSYKWTPVDIKNDKMLFSIGGDRKFMLSDFANFCKKNTKTRLKYDKSKVILEAVNELYTEFTNEKAIEFEESNLEQKYPEFKALVKEYDEGILLFEATRLNVWDKANQDTVGLKKFFESKPNTFKTEEKMSITDYVINTADIKLAQKVWTMITKKGAAKAIKKFNVKEKLIIAKTADQEKGAKEAAGLEWIPGSFTNLTKDVNNQNVFIFKTADKLIPSRLKSLDEARGYIVADYQDYLEKEWIKSLEQEFPVTIYKDAINNLKK
jgi:peptidyl-prolyl cis-trans isomerase SurA